MSRKKRMILTARELEAQQRAGPASNRGEPHIRCSGVTLLRHEAECGHRGSCCSIGIASLLL